MDVIISPAPPASCDDPGSSVCCTHGQYGVPKNPSAIAPTARITNGTVIVRGFSWAWRAASLRGEPRNTSATSRVM
jgi:hypothetical protein